MIVDNDQRTAEEKVEEVLNAIQSKNNDMLTSLFSEVSLNKAATFDESVQELFDYFEGTVESYDEDGIGTFADTTKEIHRIVQIMESSCDVETTECKYRFAIQYVTKDTANRRNLGLHSLYIIKVQDDDTYPEYAYWGDGEFTPGIHIGIPNTE